MVQLLELFLEHSAVLEQSYSTIMQRVWSTVQWQNMDTRRTKDVRL